jgi:myo-inositol catabolism protein IolC
MYKSADYEQVVKQAKSGNRDDVIVIVLGRAESKDNVETWLREGAKVTGVNGFAVGRTVFMEDLELVIKKAETEEQAINNISYKFVHFYNFFKQNKL